MSIHIQLEQFEGPMGLLLYLIKKEEMDISNIQIHKITSQYLDYIKVMRNFDLEVAGDFVAMAATLIHIKSRMLLPNYNEAGEVVEDSEDPRKELVNRLLEYQKYQEASKKLNELSLLGRDVFARGMKEAYEAGVEEIELEDNGLYQMISLYRIALVKMKKRVHKVYAKGQSIASRIMEIKDRIVYGKPTDLRALLTDGERSRTKLLITFLSLLELTRLGFINIFQSDVYGTIHISATKEIERDVVSRVQEYDTQDADSVASSWMERSAREDTEEQAFLAKEAAAENLKEEAPLVSPVTTSTVSVEQTDSNAGTDESDLEFDSQFVPVSISDLEAIGSKTAPHAATPENMGPDELQLASSWEDEVIDQLGDLSEDEFENLLNDPVLDPIVNASAELSEMSPDLETRLDERTTQLALEELESLTEYQADSVSSFSYEGSLETVATIQATALDSSELEELTATEISASSTAAESKRVAPSSADNSQDNSGDESPHSELST